MSLFTASKKTLPGPSVWSESILIRSNVGGFQGWYLLLSIFVLDENTFFLMPLWNDFSIVGCCCLWASISENWYHVNLFLGKIFLQWCCLYLITQMLAGLDSWKWDTICILNIAIGRVWPSSFSRIVSAQSSSRALSADSTWRLDRSKNELIWYEIYCEWKNWINHWKTQRYFNLWSNEQ